MSKNDSSKPRIREITEGALATIIATLILAFLGITGGVITIGWFPTFMLLILVGGGFYLWYRNDKSLQRLINQRFFKIKHAISSESVVLPRWNLIVEEVLPQIAKQSNLSRDFLQLQHRRNIYFRGREYLEMVLDYRNGYTKWLAVIDNNGNIINLHGGFTAVVGECDNCGASILVKYGQDKSGKLVSEQITTCRLCNNKMNLSVVDLAEQTNINSGVVLKNKKISTFLKDGNVWAHIEFKVQNFGQSLKISPHLELKIASLQNGSYVESIEKIDLQPILIEGAGIKPISFDWPFPLSTIILGDKPNGLKIEIKKS